MLSKFDDYPIHQTPEPIARAGDRATATPTTATGSTATRTTASSTSASAPRCTRTSASWTAASRSCATASSTPSTPRAARRASRAELEVGPFRIEILEPMKRAARGRSTTTRPASPPTSLWIPRTASFEEGHQTLRRTAAARMDATRFNQFGHWQGEIRYAGQHACAIDPDARVRHQGPLAGASARSAIPTPAARRRPRAAAGSSSCGRRSTGSDRCTHVGIFENDARRAAGTGTA